jgi:hypothetical protein
MVACLDNFHQSQHQFHVVPAHGRDGNYCTHELLYGFNGKKIELVASISLSVSFDTLANAHTEYITFDVVDMSYPYNVIFGRGLFNTFKAVFHSLYLCLMVPATLGSFQYMATRKVQET